MKLTLKAVSKALPPGYELVKGDGYYYFNGPDTSRWYATSVPVFRLNDLPLKEWLKEFEALSTDPRNSTGSAS